MSEHQQNNGTGTLETFWEILGQAEQVIRGNRFLNAGGEVPDFSGLVRTSTQAEEAPPEIQAMSLEEIAGAVGSCTACALHAGRTLAVPGAGVLHPEVMVIGEAPGKQEDLQGRPFVGRSGAYLDKWMQAIGLSRERDLFIGNIIKCRPPNNRDPLPEEQKACMPYLLRQIELIEPRTILCLGRVAAQIMLETEEGLGKLRGRTFTFAGVPLMVTYHPSAVLRSPERFRRPVWEDLQRLKSLLDSHDEQGQPGVR